MIKSMTGYGKSEAQIGDYKIIIEIKTLNSKNADINIKSSILPKNKELLVRQLISNKLYRGTIDFYLSIENNKVDTRTINEDVAMSFFNQILTLRKNDSTMANIDINQVWASVLNIPDIYDSSKKEIINEENWDKVYIAIEQALDKCNEYREKEGEALYKDITCRIDNILSFEKQVEEYEGERIATVKERLTKALNDLQQSPDPNRYEQELIYYLEKYDINEEKVRLRQHCKYFLEIINQDEYPGKKLGFILQEIGREINTTGSKANHTGIQQLVVKMKDELEKMKEQSLNIL